MPTIETNNPIFKYIAKTADDNTLAKFVAAVNATPGLSEKIIAAQEKGDLTLVIDDKLAAAEGASFTPGQGYLAN